MTSRHEFSSNVPKPATNPRVASELHSCAAACTRPCPPPPPPPRTFGLLRMTAKLSPSDPFFFFFFLGDLGLPPSASMAQ